MKRAAIMRITQEAMAKALGFPRGHRIVAVVPPDREAVVNGFVEVVVEGPLMPIQGEGETPRVVSGFDNV